MIRSDLDRLHDWFTPYCASYLSKGDGEARRNYLLKEEHTRRVCQAAVTIAGDVGLAGNDLLLAESIALLHDVGRFPQYRKFRTFKDADSENHGIGSVRVISDEKLLAELPKAERRLILRSVALHNVYRIPKQSAPREIFFLRLIRDADKLDIWRVFLEQFNLPENERASAVGLGFPDTPACSPELLTTINEGNMINLRDVRTVNDFKLLQLSWLFDLNFAPTVRLFRDRGYLAAFAAILPPSREVQETLTLLESFLDRSMNVGEAKDSGETRWIR
jgi:HD domain